MCRPTLPWQCHTLIVAVKTLKITLDKRGPGSRQARHRRCELTVNLGRFWFRPFPPSVVAALKAAPD